MPPAPITRPALRYYGAKWRLATWIISHFPEHQTYVEPFGGSSAVLLRKRPSRFEIYNDLDSDIVNFFRVLRERTPELLHALKYTPYSREEFEAAFQPAPADTNPLSSVERARLFFISAWQGFGGPRKTKLTGWKIQKRAWESGRADQIVEWNTAKDLSSAARRLSRVQIEHADALQIIRHFDTPRTLFYCDPPYPADTRNHKWCKNAYNLEINGQYHYHLANLLKRIQGQAVISTYPNPLYDELFAGWTRVEKTCQTMNKTQATELLYISPSSHERFA